MYGSAAVIGLMMCQVMGVTDDRAFPYAHKLGDAMQMTNFLRDIREDFIELDRIYLPEQDLKKYNLTHRDIIDFCKNENKNLEKQVQFKEYMQVQIVAIRSMYREAEQ
jgi:15-cis-phytoene synthase